MTLQKITLTAFAVTIMLSCSPSKNEEIKKAPATVEFASNQKQNQKQEPSKDLTEEKMDLWFLAFNYYQSKGYDMETADKMAVEAVAKQLNTKSLEVLASSQETDLD